MGRKRKPGGGRKKSKPDYNPSAILQNQMDAAAVLYSTADPPSLQTIADELDINPIKVRKLLITSGVYKTTVAGRAARAKDKELEAWLREISGMDRLVEDCVGSQVPLWEEIMVRQGSVCCAWEKSAFEEGMKVGIRLMMEAYSL